MDIDRHVNILIRRYRTNCPFLLAARLNLHVRFAALPKRVRGFSCRIAGRRFIVIQDALPFIWKRFVCAHELGHVQLHRGLSYFQLQELSPSHLCRYEREAHRFAVLLLTADRL
ncbi:MAG: ImmA/IrrE family metallo-endopeptidase [Alicyclobacillaceae bacterium]|nr:ImmA/IrrE family metallo-endopeptidase [Alicyclobacillaceae bacterium]